MSKTTQAARKAIEDAAKAGVISDGARKLAHKIVDNNELERVKSRVSNPSFEGDK